MSLCLTSAVDIFKNSSGESETHLALISVCHMIQSWVPTAPERSREATWFHSTENTSRHLNHQLMDKQIEKEKVKKVESFLNFVRMPPSLLTQSTAAHYAWLLNRHSCIFMMSQLMCWLCGMMQALLVAYELTRMSLIKECNSIKSDHSHYPVHLVGLWLGSCYTQALTHTHTCEYVWESALMGHRHILKVKNNVYLLLQKVQIKTKANQNAHMKVKWFTCRLVGSKSNTQWGQNTQTHLETIPLEPWLCCTIAPDASTWLNNKHTYSHTYSHTQTQAQIKICATYK